MRHILPHIFLLMFLFCVPVLPAEPQLQKLSSSQKGHLEIYRDIQKRLKLGGQAVKGKDFYQMYYGVIYDGCRETLQRHREFLSKISDKLVSLQAENASAVKINTCQEALEHMRELLKQEELILQLYKKKKRQDLQRAIQTFCAEEQELERLNYRPRARTWLTQDECRRLLAQMAQQQTKQHSSPAAP